MAEILLSTIAEGVMGKLVSLSSQEIGLACSVKSELKELQDTLSAINAVLLDAEKQQSKKHAVRDWMEKLKDVVYDIDDVLDDFATEALKKSMKEHWRNLKWVRNLCSYSNPIFYRIRMGHKIKKITERLNKISYVRRDFQLGENVVDSRVEIRREGTHSYVLASEVIGRANDKEKILQFIMSNRDHSHLLCFPIVGLGGLGKTTLAKLVYNDEIITQSYQLRLWVCVSEDSRLIKVIEKIIKSAGCSNCDGLDLDQLQNRLREIISAKSFFLVLDDVWNDDPKWWAELRILLIDGAKGSTVLITTRSQKVALIMGTVSLYNLGGIAFDDCLSLFWKCAFNKGKEKEYPKLLKIGEDIVTKCDGVPLAVKTLGSLLYSKTDLHEWSYIRDSDLWRLDQKEDDILPALRLSYEQLPSYLKQCFAYCAIFPKDYGINREELISHWMAQGFLQPRGSNRQPEDIGNQYCEELLSRSFFHDIIYSFNREPLSFKMHDLVVDLARLVAGTEFLDVNFGRQSVPDGVRHVLFTERNFQSREFPVSLISAKKLRSFAFAFRVGLISKSFVDTLIASFACLRDLDLGESEFEVLPRSIGNLKHLRFLRFAYNCRIKALPNSICKLINLQTLDLDYCEQLQGLPQDFGKMINLRFMLLTSQLICMPENGLQGLTSLRTLFLRNCNQLASLSEGIQHLTSLQALRIYGCPSLASLPCSLKNLGALEELEIRDCEELNLWEAEDLQGLRSLRTLLIKGIPKMVVLPQGLVQSSSTLQFLCITDCSSFSTLPEWFPSLTSLQVLHLDSCTSLLSLTEGMQGLTMLQELHIKGCPHLYERCKAEKGEDWPKISHIPQIMLEENGNDVDGPHN